MSRKNYAYINKDMLIWARSNTPFQSVYDVKDYLKFDVSRLIAYENGSDLPSITEAKALAKLYKVPFATFYLSEAPEKEPKKYTDRRTTVGTEYGDISYSLWAEIERINANRDKVLSLVEENEIDLPVFDSNSDIKTIANGIRKFLELKLPFKNKSSYVNAFNYYRKLLESRGILISQIYNVSLSEMKGISISYKDFPIIAVNNKDYDRAKAFSLVHELVHIIRRTSSLCSINFNERDDDEEKLCDKIAAEIMMPENEFTSICSLYPKDTLCSIEILEKISDRFAVSSFAVVRRLYELNIISKTDYLSTYEDLSDSFEKNREEIEFHQHKKTIIIPYHTKYLNREGYLYTRIIISSYSSGKITFGEMCNTLNVSRKHIKNLEKAVMFQ